jgi:hypothetical protein
MVPKIGLRQLRLVGTKISRRLAGDWRVNETKWKTMKKERNEI